MTSRNHPSLSELGRIALPVAGRRLHGQMLVDSFGRGSLILGLALGWVHGMRRGKSLRDPRGG